MTTLAVVLVKLAIVAVPLGALARGTSIYPTRRLVLLLIVPGLLSFALFAGQWVLVPLLAIDLALGAVALADLLSLPGQRTFSIAREAGRIVSLGRSHPVTLTFTNHADRRYAVALRDGVPHELNPDPAEFTLDAGPRSRHALHYALRAARRGAFTLEETFLRVTSRLGLWRRYLAYPAATVVNVYPDLHQLRQYALMARTNRLSLLGVRRTRRIGTDNEFERLRDYTIDDNYRHIDWRSTARRQKLTVRDFQASQSQRIIFLIDCGRMMTNEAAGISLLDHALNAMLMLSYVALRQGDAVGLVCFSDAIHTFVPPRGGPAQMNRLLHASFDRFPALVESRYDQAFRYLASHCRRRSLVVLVTNVIDEVNANQIEQYLANLVGKHLPMGVLLRDRRLFQAVEEEFPTGRALWRAAAAAEILHWRHQAIADLQRKGVLALDAFPEEMTAPLINQYLEVKARHLL